MKIIRYLQSDKIIELGIENKELFLKFTGLQIPVKLGTFEELQKIGKNRTIKNGDKEIETPEIIKNMSRGINNSILQLANSFSEEEFFNDILLDIKEQSNEGFITYVGVYNEWL
jgi:hypothetical protein